jgi:hypothetical protein
MVARTISAEQFGKSDVDIIERFEFVLPDCKLWLMYCLERAPRLYRKSHRAVRHCNAGGGNSRRHRKRRGCSTK